MSPNAHVRLFITVQFLGLFCGGLAGYAFSWRLEPNSLAVPALVLGGAALGWAVPSGVAGLFVPARCSRCGQRTAYLAGTRPYSYRCRSCGGTSRTRWREPDDFELKWDR